MKLNGHQTVDKLEVNGPTPHGFKGPETAGGVAQSGSRLSGDACFTATFGLWSARKNAHKGRAGSLFWLLGRSKVSIRSGKYKA